MMDAWKLPPAGRRRAAGVGRRSDHGLGRPAAGNPQENPVLRVAPAELEALAEAVVVARYRKNQVLFVEGEPSHSLYFICRGRVKVYRGPLTAAADLAPAGGRRPISVVPF